MMGFCLKTYEHDELLDCPMCGSRPSLHINSTSHYSLVHVECPCGTRSVEEKSLSASPDSPDAEIVIQSWNERV